MKSYVTSAIIAILALAASGTAQADSVDQLYIIESRDWNVARPMIAETDGWWSYTLSYDDLPLDGNGDKEFSFVISSVNAGYNWNANNAANIYRPSSGFPNPVDQMDIDHVTGYKGACCWKYTPDTAGNITHGNYTLRARINDDSTMCFEFIADGGSVTPRSMWINTNLNSWSTLSKLDVDAEGNYSYSIHKDPSSNSAEEAEFCFKLTDSDSGTANNWANSHSHIYGAPTSDLNPWRNLDSEINAGSTKCWKISKAQIPCPGTFGITATYIGDSSLKFRITFTPDPGTSPAALNPDKTYLVIDGTKYVEIDGDVVPLQFPLADLNAHLQIAKGERLMSVSAIDDITVGYDSLDVDLVESDRYLIVNTDDGYKLTFSDDYSHVAVVNLAPKPEAMWIVTGADWTKYIAMKDLGDNTYSYTFDVKAGEEFYFKLSERELYTAEWNNKDFIFGAAETNGDAMNDVDMWLYSGQKNCWSLNSAQKYIAGTYTITVKCLKTGLIEMHIEFVANDIIGDNPDKWFIIAEGYAPMELVDGIDTDFHIGDDSVNIFIAHQGQLWSFGSDTDITAGCVAADLVVSDSPLIAKNKGTYRFVLNLADDQPSLEVYRTVNLFIGDEAYNDWRSPQPLDGRESLHWESVEVEQGHIYYFKFSANPASVNGADGNWSVFSDEQFGGSGVISYGDMVTSVKGATINCWNMTAPIEGRFVIDANYMINSDGKDQLQFVVNFVPSIELEADKWYYRIGNDGRYNEFDSYSDELLTFTADLSTGVPIRIYKGDQVYGYSARNYYVADELTFTQLVESTGAIYVNNDDTYTFYLSPNAEVPDMSVTRVHFHRPVWRFSLNDTEQQEFPGYSEELCGNTWTQTFTLFADDYVKLYRDGGEEKVPQYRYVIPYHDGHVMLEGSLPESQMLTTSYVGHKCVTPGYYTFIVRDGAWTLNPGYHTLEIVYEPFNHLDWPDGADWCYVTGATAEFTPMNRIVYPDYTLWEAIVDFDEFSSRGDIYLQFFHDSKPYNSADEADCNWGIMPDHNLAFHLMADGSEKSLKVDSAEAVGEVKATIRRYNDESDYYLRIKRVKHDDFSDAEEDDGDVSDYTLDIPLITLSQEMAADGYHVGEVTYDAQSQVMTAQFNFPDGVTPEYHWAKYEHSQWDLADDLGQAGELNAANLWRSDSYIDPQDPRFQMFYQIWNGNPASTSYFNPYNRAHAIDRNTGISHVCRNFSKSYYRVYGVSSDAAAMVRPASNDVKVAKGVITADHTSTYNSRVAYTRTVSNNTTGIESVGIDSPADEEPVYYNLQGVLITHPVSGQVYIVRRGATVTKQLYR